MRGAVLLGVVAFGCAQAQEPRFTTRAREVVVPVSVISKRGGDAALAKTNKTASIVSNYITNDRETGAPSLAALVTASGEVRAAQEFTAVANALDDAFARVKAVGEGARVLDGVSLAWELLAARKESARRGVVVIS